MRWIKSMKRSTLVLIGLFLIGGAVAFAAFTHFSQTEQKDSTFVPQPFIKAEIEVGDLSGNIAPGDTKSVTAIVSNSGTADGVAFIRFSYPVISEASGMAGSAYTWEVNSGWSAVEEGVGYTVYGYSSPLGGDASAENLMDTITMKNMSAEEFKSLGDDVNVHFIGFVAECNEFGDDPQAAWNRANQ